MTWELDDLPERYRKQAAAQLRPMRETVRTIGPADLTEKQWQAMVVKYAHDQGWWVRHDHDSRRSEPGWPDLVFIRPPRIIFAELKAEDGKLRREQPHVMGLLRACELPVFLWRPSCWPEVQRELA